MIVGEWGTKPAARRKIKVAKNKRARETRDRGSERERARKRTRSKYGGERESSESTALAEYTNRRINHPATH